MRYLYADSTPFPLSQNFLATLCAGTDACVAILKADEQVDESNRTSREAEQRAVRELAQLSGVAHRIEAALGSDVPESARAANPGEATLTRIRELAVATLEQARADVLKARDGRIAAAMASSPRAQVLPALSTFLSTHELPDTAWGVRWTGGLGPSATRAELYARTPFGLESQFDVAIPATHVWARPASVALLGVEASISLTVKPWARKPRPVELALGPMYVTNVVLTPERASVRLSKSKSSPSEGIELVFGGEGSSLVTATRVDKAGYPLGEGQRLGTADAAVAHRLWNRVTSTLGTLVTHRTRAVSCKLGGVPVAEIPRPEVVASTLIRALAPYVREIAKRTAVTGELALKRELGDGCREELFINYDTVLDRMTPLVPAHRALFDLFGLTEDKTLETDRRTVEQAVAQASAQVWRLPVVRPPRMRAVS